MSISHNHAKTHVFTNRSNGEVSLKCGANETLTVDSDITFNGAISGLPAFDPIVTVPITFQDTVDVDGESTFNSAMYMRYKPIYESDEILAWLRFSSSGTLHVDSSGKSNDGVVVGSPTYTALLDGKTDSITLAETGVGHHGIDMFSSLGTTLDNLDAFGMSFELRLPDSSNSHDHIFRISSAAADMGFKIVGLDATWYLNDGGSQFVFVVPLEVSKWSRIVVSTGFTHGSRFFLNGVQIGVAQSNWTPKMLTGAITKVEVGYYTADPTLTLDGSIRNMKFWGRELDGRDF